MCTLYPIKKQNLSLLNIDLQWAWKCKDLSLCDACRSLLSFGPRSDLSFSFNCWCIGSFGSSLLDLLRRKLRFAFDDRINNKCLWFRPRKSCQLHFSQHWSEPAWAFQNHRSASWESCPYLTNQDSGWNSKRGNLADPWVSIEMYPWYNLSQSAHSYYALNIGRCPVAHGEQPENGTSHLESWIFPDIDLANLWCCWIWKGPIGSEKLQVWNYLRDGIFTYSRAALRIS